MKGIKVVDIGLDIAKVMEKMNRAKSALLNKRYVKALISVREVWLDLLIDKINNKFNFQANVAATHSYRTLFGKNSTIYKLDNKMNDFTEKYIDHPIRFEGISDQLKDHRIVSWTDNYINFNKRMTWEWLGKEQ